MNELIEELNSKTLSTKLAAEGKLIASLEFLFYRRVQEHAITIVMDPHRACSTREHLTLKVILLFLTRALLKNVIRPKLLTDETELFILSLLIAIRAQFKVL